MTTQDNHRLCGRCPFLLQSVSHSDFYCGAYAALNGTALALDAKIIPSGRWHSPQPHALCLADDMKCQNGETNDPD